MHSVASPLAVEQNSSGSVQGRRSGRRGRRHRRDRQGRQRREFLRRTPQLHCPDEKPSRQIQRPEVRRQKRSR